MTNIAKPSYLFAIASLLLISMLYILSFGLLNSSGGQTPAQRALRMTTITTLPEPMYENLFEPMLFTGSKWPLKRMPYSKKEWSMVRKLQTLSAYKYYMDVEQPSLTFPQVYELYPVTYDCDRNQMLRIGGEGDGAKWYCGEFSSVSVSSDSNSNSEDECVVFSLGSNGDFTFEQAFRKQFGDSCKIFTFDCTGEWTDPSTEFRPWCLDGRDRTDGGRIYKTWSTILRDVGVKHVSYLKIDIEGFEFEVIPEVLTSPVSELPRQVAIEVHAPDAQKDLSEVKAITQLMLAFENAGYQIASNEINVKCDRCCEFVLARPDVLYQQ